MQGVPGTAMPAWGDRMVESDIQAIVGLHPSNGKPQFPKSPGLLQWAEAGRQKGKPGGGPPWANDRHLDSAGLSGSTGEIHPRRLDALRPKKPEAGGAFKELAG